MDGHDLTGKEHGRWLLRSRPCGSRISGSDPAQCLPRRRPLHAFVTTEIKPAGLLGRYMAAYFVCSIITDGVLRLGVLEASEDALHGERQQHGRGAKRAQRQVAQRGDHHGRTLGIIEHQ